MGVLGTIILVFIVIHLIHFWGEMKFGGLDQTVYVTESGKEVKDLYTLTVRTFQDAEMGLIWAFVYLLSMIAIALHLYHGFGSGFQSLGINHPRYNGLIRKLGVAFAIIIPLLFAIIPFYIYFVLDKI